MQEHVVQTNNKVFKNLENARSDSLLKEALGVINPYVRNSSLESEAAITQKQIEILEDAIRRFERLEDVRKFSAIALDDIETVTEEEIQRAVELENLVSIEDERAVLNLIQNEGFLRDLESADFTEILASCGENSSENSLNFDDEKNEDFSDFDF